MRDLGTLGGAPRFEGDTASRSYANAINESGQVTGTALTANGDHHAFLWDGATMQDLNDAINPADPLQGYVTLNVGYVLNALGQILVGGCDSRTSECHAYVMSPVDTTADAFSFPNQTGVAPSGVVTSNAVAISGIDDRAQISVSGGEYSIGCSGTFTAGIGAISNGETVCVRLTASSAFGTATTATLEVGDVSGVFTVTTRAAPPPAAPPPNQGGGGAIGFTTLLPLFILLRRRKYPGMSLKVDSTVP